VKAVTFQDIGQMRVTDVPEPSLELPSDAIVKVTCCAICGSDLHLYHGDIPMMPGDTCGHEFTGVIVDSGNDVTGFKRGDRVVGTFHTACGACRACRRGEFHLCDEGAVYGYGPIYGSLNGTQAEYARIPMAEVNLRIVPDGLEDEQAIFAGDILTTAYGAVKNAGVSSGDTVAVIGCGPVGIMAVQSALSCGAARVLAIDLVAERVQLAVSVGAIGVDSSQTDVVGAIMRLTDGEGADAVIEAVGGPRTLLLAFELVRPGGRIAAVGITAAQSFEYPLTQALTKDVTFRMGLANIHRDIDEVLGLIASGAINPSIVISHRLALEEAALGYELFDSRVASKVLLIPQ
jgi:threonine dehydrogenase-like Zn-dependent dehydrogenase